MSAVIRPARVFSYELGFGVPENPVDEKTAFIDLIQSGGGEGEGGYLEGRRSPPIYGPENNSENAISPSERITGTPFLGFAINPPERTWDALGWARSPSASPVRPPRLDRTRGGRRPPLGRGAVPARCLTPLTFESEGVRDSTPRPCGPEVDSTSPEPYAPPEDDP